MVRYEAKCRGVCLEVFDLSAGQGRASEAVRIVTASVDTGVEMGGHCYGFCCGIAEDDMTT